MKIVPVVSALVLILFSCSSPGPQKAPEPRSKADGPFRIAVVQSGDYTFYNAVLAGIHSGLADLGWASPGPIDLNADQPIPVLLQAWKNPTDHVVLDPDFFIDLKFDESGEVPPALQGLLDGSRGADLVISLGTVAGRLIARADDRGQVHVPVMIESVSDPVGTGIITSNKDSGRDRFTATTDPNQYDRQIRLFHRIVGFHKLGMIYTDNETGRSYAALSIVQKAAADLKFDIVSETGVLDDPADESGVPAAEAAYVEAFERLSQAGVDAVYVTIQAGLTPRTVPLVAALAEKTKLPTFAMEGSDLVRMGLMAGESRKIQVAEGLFSADKVARILAGAQPRSLAQIMEHKPHIALNLIVARSIGFTIPAEVLLEADEVYGP